MADRLIVAFIASLALAGCDETSRETDALQGSLGGVEIDEVTIEGHRVFVFWKMEMWAESGGLSSEHIREICPACLKAKP